MQKLNLTNKCNSDISWDLITFPDGEKLIKLGEFDRKDKVHVICRITSANDLFILMQIGDILNRHEVEWGLTILYLMSMRMDRVIAFNMPYNLKIVADIIKSLGPSSITVAHPHSEKTLNLLKSKEGVCTHPYLEYEGKQLCFPDAGALRRYTKHYSYLIPALIGKKNRNPETGKIESIIIENPEDYQGLPVVVVDDLCDAGGTFLGIAKAIREIDKDAKLSINIIHMVNRIGIDNLSKTYDKVYFSNSYKEWEELPDNCIMYDVTK